MSSLGAPQRLYITFQAAVARFDVVAAEGLRDAGIMEKVLAGMDDGWEAAVSRSGYFGFIYNDKIQMVKDLGTYPWTWSPELANSLPVVVTAFRGRPGTAVL